MPDNEKDSGANAFLAMLNKYVADVDFSNHAKWLYSVYSAYVKAGFTEQQAMQIISCIIINSINKEK